MSNKIKIEDMPELLTIEDLMKLFDLSRAIIGDILYNFGFIYESKRVMRRNIVEEIVELGYLQYGKKTFDRTAFISLTSHISKFQAKDIITLRNIVKFEPRAADNEPSEPKITPYYKLVRDKTAEIVKKNGGLPITEQLNGKKYEESLDKKLVEETNEYLESKEPEELADIVQVIYAILKHKGISIAEFEEIRNKKVQEKGGFDERIFLKEVRESR